MNETLDVLELCSGFGGLSKGFVDAGDRVTRVDFDPRFADVPGTVIADVREFRGAERYDVILSGPPCQGFSLAAVGRHYSRDRTPDATVLLGREVVRAVLSFIERHPESIWLLENPSGMLRNYIGRPRERVFYCSYGDTRMKPTHFWGNYPTPLRLPCLPHADAPRGSKNPGSTQWLHDPAERAIVPIALSRRIRETIVAAGPRQATFAHGRFA